jgi:hypothetical protein
MDVDLIEEKKREIKEEIDKFTMLKLQELHKYCLANGGHHFTDWASIWNDKLDDSLSYYSFRRSCWLCGRVEYASSKP